MQTIKCFIVGDRVSEKTRLWMSYVTNKTNCEYIPNFFDNYSLNIMFDGKPITLSIWDMVEDSDILRPLSYEQTDVFIICFSIVSPLSFDSVREKWWPEIQYYCPGKPIILVATQMELKKDPETLLKLKKNKQSPIKRKQGRAISKKTGAKYLACSLHNLDEVKNVFEEAIRAVICPKIKSKSKCCSLL